MSAVLREYQNNIISEARGLMRQGIKSILIQSPTGSGKTLLTAHMLGTAAGKGLHCWFMCHRRELIKQSISTFAQVGIKHGVVAAGWFEEPHLNVQLASVQTVARRVNRIKNPKLIIWDEAHHVAAGSWSKIHSAFPDAFHIGLTATPFRLDGGGLGDLFADSVRVATIEDLTARGYLVPVRYWAHNTPDMRGIKKARGDFDLSEFKTSLLGDPIKSYLSVGEDARAIAFCINVEHSKQLA